MSDSLLDTDTLIRCLRGVPATLRLAQELTAEGDLHVSVWSHLEILTLAPAHEGKRTLEFLSPFIMHPINDEIAQRAAELLRAQSKTETPLTFGEALIAATAMHHGLTLVTYSPKNFQSLSELRIFSLPTTTALRGKP